MVEVVLSSMEGFDGTGAWVLMSCSSDLCFLQVVGVILVELGIAAAGLLGRHRGPCSHSEEVDSNHVGLEAVEEVRTGIVIEVGSSLVVVVVALNRGHSC